MPWQSSDGAEGSGRQAEEKLASNGSRDAFLFGFEALRQEMIRAISAAETIAVRWPVLRPGFPRETAIFEGDELPTPVHFGAFDGHRLVGVASVFPASLPERADVTPAWQLRGMATLPEVRGRGFGCALLDSCVAAARERRSALIWCNARTTASAFYAKHGWQTVGDEFNIATVGPHFRMFLALR